MKKQHLLLSLLALLFSLLSAQEAVAKTETRQDALYIFRNDGGFDCFFYGDIDRIAYSKIDTAGVEQPDYVVQEVWALDTVFRIPLTAIDSVAFITPETKVWPDVFCPDDRIGNYIIDGDSIWWIRLSHDTPPDLLPTVGGKLLIEEGVSQFIPDGFGGRVAVVEHEDEGWLIVTEPTDVTEIYERLVIKNAATTAQVPSRAPSHGFGIDGAYYSEVPEVNIPILDIDKKYTLSYGAATAEGDNWSIGANLTGTVETKYSNDLTLRAFLFVDVPNMIFNSNAVVTWHHTAETELSVAGELSGRIELPFGGKIKKNIGGLKIEIGAGLFMEGSIGGYEVKQSTMLDEEYKVIAGETCDNFLSVLTMGYNDAVTPFFKIGRKVIESEAERESYLPYEDGEWHLPNTASIACGVFAKAETQIAIPIDKALKALPKWLVKYMLKYVNNENNDTTGFKIGLGLDVGGKLSMKAPWEAFLKEESLLESGDSYNQLNNGSEFKASLFAKGGATLTLGPWNGAEPQESEVAFKTLGLVPLITHLRASIDQYQEPIKPYLHRFVSPITRDLMLPTTVGFVVYDVDQNIHAKYCGTPWSGADSFENDQGHNFFSNGTYFRSLSIDPGKGETAHYTAYPMVKLINGHEMIVEGAKLMFEVDSARFDIPQRTLYLGPEGGKVQGQYVGNIEVSVTPNMENVQVNAKDAWLHDLIWFGDRNKLSIFWNDLPEGVQTRQSTIYLTGLSKLGEELTVDSISVIQARPYVIVEPNKMEFTIEGGTQTATIVETSLRDITARIASPDISVTMDGDIITVTATENTDESSRYDWVILEGTSPEGLQVSYHAIEITQEGLGGDDPGTFEPTTKRMLWDTNISYDVATRIVTQDTTFYATMSSGGSFYHDEHDNDDDWAYYIYKEDITDSGTSLHVKLYSKETPMQNGIPTGSYVVETLSFDILNYNNIAVGGRQISNIRHERNGYIDNELYESWEIEIANLPITEYYDSEIEGYHQQSISAGGTAYGGVNIISGKVTYYVPDDDGEIHVLNYPFSVDHPDNTVEFEVDFFGDFGEYYYWNEEIGEYLPEGVDPGDWPDDPDWDKAKTIDNPKVTIGSKMKKRAKLLNKRIGNNKND